MPAFDRFKVISFDIFDTLITRLLSKPKDVFSLVEERAIQDGIIAHGFADARVAAERAARAASASEVSLIDIYRELEKDHRFRDSLASLKAMELDAERDLCVAMPEGRALFEAAISKGNPVVLVSDMYLPRDFLEGLLQSCGYAGWTRCFVSCEFGATKAKGTLYGVVAREMDIKPSEMLHIGDNLKSDIIQARRAGVITHKINTKLGEANDLAESFVSAARRVNNKSWSRREGSNLEGFGYCALGPVLVGFCSWLTNELRSEGINKVFYLARDGLIVQRAMQSLGNDALCGTYLYASRRALQVPSFALTDSFEAIVGSMFLPRKVSLRHVFSKMGLDEEDAVSAMLNMGIDPDVESRSDRLATNSDALRAYGALAPYVKKNSKAKLSLLEQYLRQNGFSGKVALVDIGWFGNMQIALEKVCKAAGIDAEIHGYYVGLSPEGKNQTKHRMKGYLFDALHDVNLFEQERCYNHIFETLFSSTHGSTQSYYAEEDGRIVPVLSDYTGVEAETGYRAERCREGALLFVRDWHRVFRDDNPTISPNVALESLNRVGIDPSLSEARFFGDWAMEADGKAVYAARPSSLRDYCLKPGKLVKDFARASWKAGFLKRLFKVPFPYGKLWMVVHSLYKKMR